MQQIPENPKKGSGKAMIIILIVLCVLAVIALACLVIAVAGLGSKGPELFGQTENAGLITVYNPETGKAKEVDRDMLGEYLKLGYVTDMSEVSDGAETELETEDGVVTLYKPDGESIEVSAEEAEKFLKAEDEEDKWYTEPVMYIYNVKGDKKVINKTEENDYLYPKTVNEDGQEVDLEQTPEEKWHRNPVVMMYSAKGRTVVINADEQYVNQYIDAGWYLDPVTTVTKQGQPNTVVKIAELDKYLAEGWTEYDPDAAQTAQVCSYCGSGNHTTSSHPRCQYCNSASHTSANHPSCAVCGSRSHTSSEHPRCAVCGSTAHTKHPEAEKCSICGSTSHKTAGHPKCSYCGSTSHTTHPSCSVCGSYEHTQHPKPTCDYCGSTSHSTNGHPTCSWCGRRDHTGAEHDAVIAAENAVTVG